MPAVCVIAVSVCEDRLPHRLPGVDVKIALTAIEPTVGESYQAGAFHVKLFYNGAADYRQKKTVRQ